MGWDGVGEEGGPAFGLPNDARRPRKSQSQSLSLSQKPV